MEMKEGAYARAKKYLQEHPAETKKLKRGGPVITISRQTGIGAEKICILLAGYLEKRAAPGYHHWGYFDKNLIEKVMEDHHLPDHLARYLSENYLQSKDSALNELFGIHPPKTELIHKTASTILGLAETGNVIIVGRGANLITANMKCSFHIRLVAPIQQRIKQAAELYGKSFGTEKSFVAREDEARKRFIKKYYMKDISDPLLYHIIINTSLLTFEETAETIGSLVIKKFPAFFV